MRNEVIAAVALLVVAGCTSLASEPTHDEPGHLSAIEIPDDSPARAAPITDEELERAPELERVLAARGDMNGTASLTVEPRHVDRVTAVLEGKPSYGPDSPLFHRDGVYLRYGAAVVLVKTPDDIARIYVIPTDVTLRRVPINDIDEDAWTDHTELRDLVERAASADDVVSQRRNETPNATLEFVASLEAYRPEYNDRRYWGRTVEYRDRRYALSIWQNDTAT
jgi:hypothetical protein